MGGTLSYNKTELKSICLLWLITSALSCNKVSMTDLESSQTNTLSVPPDTSYVQASCNTINKQRRTVDYNFPKPNYTCEWDKNGNLNKKNDYFQARIEQTRDLVMEPNVILCDIKFNFDTQTFLYDDHFIFTFNDAVIASSYNFSDKLNSEYGLLRYDWSKLAGMYWDKEKEGVYCASGGNCGFPKHDIAGTIQMSYPSLLFQKLMAENLNRKAHQLKFISIGDNDEQDCEHSNIDFQIVVEYVNK
jgi:hypothetical protein